MPLRHIGGSLVDFDLPAELLVSDSAISKLSDTDSPISVLSISSIDHDLKNTLPGLTEDEDYVQGRSNRSDSARDDDSESSELSLGDTYIQNLIWEQNLLHGWISSPVHPRTLSRQPPIELFDEFEGGFDSSQHMRSSMHLETELEKEPHRQVSVYGRSSVQLNAKPEQESRRSHPHISEYVRSSAELNTKHEKRSRGAQPRHAHEPIRSPIQLDGKPEKRSRKSHCHSPEFIPSSIQLDTKLEKESRKSNRESPDYIGERTDLGSAEKSPSPGLSQCYHKMERHSIDVPSEGISIEFDFGSQEMKRRELRGHSSYRYPRPRATSRALIDPPEGPWSESANVSVSPKLSASRLRRGADQSSRFIGELKSSEGPVRSCVASQAGGRGASCPLGGASAAQRKAKAKHLYTRTAGASGRKFHAHTHIIHLRDV